MNENRISVGGESQNNNLLNKTYGCVTCGRDSRFNVKVKLKSVETLETVDDNKGP